MEGVVIDHLEWQRDGRDWPNRETSRFVFAAGIRWHVQMAGSGPVALLIHGSGAATHSWRDLLPLLAAHFRVVAVDLPGHGFSEKGSTERLSIAGVAQSLRALLTELDAEPELLVGHSAGAALNIFMTLEGLVRPQRLISLNGAHLPLRGYPSWLYAPIAGIISNSRLLPRLFARRACKRHVVERLLRDTGSVIDERGFELYWRLSRCPEHVSAALGLMANWNVRPVEHGLPSLDRPLLLITGSNDTTVPPTDSERVHRMVASSVHVSQEGLGHLAHEEDPQSTWEQIEAFWSEAKL